MKINIVVFLAVLTFGFNAKGQSWHDVDGGVTWRSNYILEPGIHAMATDTIHHYLYVGGEFDSAGHIPMQNLARWDGKNWSSIGNFNNDTTVFALCMYNRNLALALYPSGTIEIVDSAGDILDSFTSDGFVNSLAVYNGELYAGGGFYEINGIPAIAIARYNGSKWESVDSGMQSPDYSPEIWTLYVWNNKLYAGGTFNQAGDSLANNIVSWNDTLWKPLGSGTNTVETGGYNDGYIYGIGSYKNNLYIGGAFNLAGGILSNYLAKWNGVNWDSVGEGVNSIPYSFMSFQNNLYMAGAFDSAGGIQALGVVSWNDTSFSPLGKGITYGGYPVAIDTFNEELYFGGGFDSAGNISANNIAVWGADSTTTGGIARVSQQNNQVVVYPNPTSNLLTVNSSQPIVQLQIENVLGQLLLQKFFSDGMQRQMVDVSIFPQGIYFYRVTNINSQVVTGKFVKE